MFFYTLERILQHNVPKRPSIKLDHYSLYDGPSGSHLYVKIRLKTSCLIAHEPSLFCCSVKRDKKSRDCCYGNWLLKYDLQVIFSVCANFGRIPSNRLGTLNQFVNTLCCSHLSTGSHALIPLSLTREPTYPLNVHSTLFMATWI